VPEPEAELEPVPAAEDDEFDALFGHTVARTVEGAAVRELPDPTPAAPPAVPTAIPPSAPVAAPTVAPVAATGTPVGSPIQQPPAARRPLIDGVPGESTALAQSSPAAPTASAVPLSSSPDVEERTVRRQARPADPASDGGPAGPTVQAVRCASGHPNPPQAHSCRVCGQAVGSSSIETIARPQLGRLRFDGGESVVVNRPIIIGRAPKSPSTPGTEVPVLFTVTSPSGDVSRSHVEVAIEGWHVQAIDLGSSNGTKVTQPGMPARSLHPGEPLILQAGARVELSDEVAFTFEVVE
jgi:hypothetical protein